VSSVSEPTEIERGSNGLSAPLYRALADAVDALNEFEFSRDAIVTEASNAPTSAMHKTVGRIVVRQVDGILNQSQQYAHTVHRAAVAMMDVLLGREQSSVPGLIEQVEDLQARVTEQRREINELRRRLDAVTAQA
jgi:hypothetical protein